MKYILTESQLLKLIKEQTTKTYTNKEEYEKALKIYNKAKRLSDESLRKFNLLKNFNPRYPTEQESTSNTFVGTIKKQMKEFIKKNNIPNDDEYFEKYKDILKLSKTYVLDYFSPYPYGKERTNLTKRVKLYKAGQILNSTPGDYDASKFSWEYSHIANIYEPKMPEPILQTKHQIQPNFQSPPRKISSTPSEVIPIEQQPFKPYTPEQTEFSISWTPDLKCLFTKYYETYDDMQKEIKDFDLPLLGSRSEGKPPKYADYRTEKRQGKNFPEGPWFNSCTQEWEDE